MILKADLHIHSCLSPCGDLEMSPSAIAHQAVKRGLNIAAISDHNCALNCKAFKKACIKAGLMPVFGIEATTAEEAHILCLFKTVEQAEELGKIIYKRLPNFLNIPEKFGDQVYVDEADNIIGEVDKYLVSASDIPAEELLLITKDIGGMFIPAHIDRPVFSIPSQLGFLPEMDYTAVETVQLPCPIETGTYPLIQNSDAHYIDDIARRFTFYNMEGLSYSNLQNAIKNHIFNL